jgi:hypothetical protein
MEMATQKFTVIEDLLTFTDAMSIHQVFDGAVNLFGFCGKKHIE